MAIKAAFLPSPVSYSEIETRRAIASGFARDSSGSNLSFRTGILDGPLSPMFVTRTGPLQVTMNAGQGVVGEYLVTADSSATANVTAGTASVRYDAAVLRVRDAAAGDGSNSATFEIINGTSATGGPAIPARTMLLAIIQVPANSTNIAQSNITDRRVNTGPQGATLIVPGAATVNPPVVWGTPLYDTNNDRMYYKTNGSQTRLLSNQPIDTDPFGGGTLKNSKPADLRKLRIVTAQFVANTSAAGHFHMDTGFSECLLFAHAVVVDPVGASVICAYDFAYQGGEGPNRAVFRAFYSATGEQAGNVQMRFQAMSIGS